MDKLAFEMAGLTNVLSVPDGAPTKVKEGPIDEHDKKFRCDHGRLHRCDNVIIVFWREVM